VSRDLTNTTNQTLANKSIVAVLLLELTKSDDTVEYFTDAPFNLTVFGQTYNATDKLISISETQEVGDITVSTVNIVLSAISENAITDYAISGQINKGVTIKRCFLNTATNELFGDSGGDATYIVFKGKVSGYAIENNQDSAFITLEVASQFANFRKVNARKTNPQGFARGRGTLQENFMQYADKAVEDIKWGTKT
jgi:hypothetical protein